MENLNFEHLLGTPKKVNWVTTYNAFGIESSNNVKHYNLFRPPILKKRINCFYSNLYKCRIRVNDTQ